MKFYPLFGLSLFALLLSACGSTTGGVVDSRRVLVDPLARGEVSEQATVLEEESTIDVVEDTPPPVVNAGPVPGSRGDFVISVQDRVFFAFDSAELSRDAERVLASQAQWLQQYPSALLTVEGHADERGTRDYNLALSERRASVVRDFLVARGVAESRVRVIGYGKERPSVLGSNESAWSQNRRSVTFIEE